MKSIIRIALLAVSFTPTFAFAAVYYSGYGQDVGSIAGTFIDLINGVLIPLLFAVAFIIFIYGVAKTYIFSKGDMGEVEVGHKLILWGIIGFAVMVSVWGLVNVVTNTFQLDRVDAPSLPKSYSY